MPAVIPTIIKPYVCIRNKLLDLSHSIAHWPPTKFLSYINHLLSKYKFTHNKTWVYTKNNVIEHACH